MLFKIFLREKFGNKRKGYIFQLKKLFVVDREFIVECFNRVEESNMKRKLIFILKQLLWY